MLNTGLGAPFGAPNVFKAEPGRLFQRCLPFMANTHYAKEKAMDWDRVEGNWKQVKGKIREKWGQLTDDDLDQIAGRRDQLEGKIQERYGTAKDQVRSDVDEWYRSQRW
jgi:uncharacterized protein YjbJ (UPF0337 family)